MYTPSTKQGEAWKLLREGPSNVMLVGGSRSGKTTVIVEEILCRAIKYPGSRHLIARLRFAHAKASVWMDTLPKVLEMEGVDHSKVKFSESDHYIKINGSEIWVDGLDDKDRVDKILGREYVSVYFNECSEMPYGSITTVMTRLAQNIPGCHNKAFFDLNPVGRLHWGYKLFFQKIDPESEKPIPNPDDYSSLYLQPEDNIENLPPGYIERTLDTLPEHKRRRFRLGEWGDPEGVIFREWEIVDAIPEHVQRRGQRSHGLDFGFSVDPSALVDIWQYGDDLYLDELIYDIGLTNQALGKKIKALNLPEIIIADSAEPKSIQELSNMGIQIKGAAKGQDSVRQGIDWLLSKAIYVTRRSYNLQNELQNFAWKENKAGKALPEPVDDFDHGISAGRYGTERFRLNSSIKFKPVRGLR